MTSALIDYHGHAAPQDALLAACGRGFMPFPADPPPALWSKSGQWREMDQAGIDARVVSVPPILYGYELPGDRQAAHCRELNDWIIDFADERFQAMAILPIGDVAAALSEMRRCRAHGVQHFAIGTHVDGRHLDETVEAEVWAAIAELDGIVMIHPWKTRDEPRLSMSRLGNYLGNPFETAAAAARLIFSGIVGRYPRFPVMLAHGGGALPYLLGRMEHGWRSENPEGDEAANPAVLARRFYYDTVVFGQEQLRFLAQVVGTDRLLPGTDSPFDMGLVGTPPLILDAQPCAALEPVSGG